LRRTDKEEQYLNAFRSTLYETQKNMNPGREPETCLWFLKNSRFLDWRDKSVSCLLWVTADPGCGKSVLSRALVDERLLDSSQEIRRYATSFLKSFPTISEALLVRYLLCFISYFLLRREPHSSNTHYQSSPKTKRRSQAFSKLCGASSKELRRILNLARLFSCWTL
jgi:hypothetical protein